MGRTSILLVIGFSTIMLLAGKNMSDVGVQALDNSITYYEHTQRYSIAVAAANIACTKIWETPSWTSGFTDVNYNGGTFSVDVTSLSGGKIQVEATGTYDNTTHTITIVMSPSKFSKFAYYGGTNASAAAWETGDTVGGPSHTQGKLKTYGSPVFMGKATSKTGITMSGSPKNPQFQGGFESGVDIPMPSNTSYNNILSAATLGGYSQTGGELYVKYNADGTVSWKTSAAAAYTTVSLSTFAPNGIIAIDKGKLYVEGTLDGRVTMASLRTSGTTGGQTYITNDLVMKEDPRVNSLSNDMLGIVSYTDIQVEDNSAATFNIQATMYSYTGGLAVENGTTRPAGNLNITGGMIVERLYATSNGASGSSRRGYNLVLRFDERFASDSPDYFPSTGRYEILSWFE